MGKILSNILHAFYEQASTPLLHIANSVSRLCAFSRLD